MENGGGVSLLLLTILIVIGDAMLARIEGIRVK